jgi:hypothetical protein
MNGKISCIIHLQSVIEQSLVPYDLERRGKLYMGQRYRSSLGLRTPMEYAGCAEEGRNAHE